MTAVANVRKRQIDMSYNGEHPTLTKQSMRHQVYPGETCHASIYMTIAYGYDRVSLLN